MTEEKKGNLFTLLTSFKKEAPKLLNKAMENPKEALAAVGIGLAAIFILSNFDVKKNLQIIDWDIVRVSFSTVILVSFAAGAVAAWFFLRKKQ